MRALVALLSTGSEVAKERAASSLRMLVVVASLRPIMTRCNAVQGLQELYRDNAGDSLLARSAKGALEDFGQLENKNYLRDAMTFEEYEVVRKREKRQADQSKLERSSGVNGVSPAGDGGAPPAGGSHQKKASPSKPRPGSPARRPKK